MKAQMLVSVQVYEKGQPTKKLVAPNDIEIWFGKNKVKFNDLIISYNKELEKLQNEIAKLKEYLIKLQEKDVEYKQKTNKNIETIINKLNEMGEVF